jgi:maleate isomerase
MSSPLFTVASLADIKKIGFIVPSSNSALEIINSAILAQLPLVSAHYSRISVTHTDLAAGAASQFIPNGLLRCASLIADARVDVILWNGTSESWTGEGYAAGVHIQDLLQKGTGLPSSTASIAQVEVLQAWGIKKMGLAVPYALEPTQQLQEYYGRCGVEVVNASRLNQTVNRDSAYTPLERLRQLIRDADHPAAECIVVACTNFPAALLVEEMELELGKPIFDSVAVTLYKALRLAGVDTPVHGWGRLLRSDPVLAKLDAIMATLREATRSSRTTLRADIPARNCHCDRVVAEALFPGIPSLRPNTSLNQRALKTVQHIEETCEALVQPDTIHAAIQPPAALMSVYGVKAQMLLPLLEGAAVQGWISVHDATSTREWTPDETTALKEAGSKVCAILEESGWAQWRLKEDARADLS